MGTVAQHPSGWWFGALLAGLALALAGCAALVAPSAATATNAAQTRTPTTCGQLSGFAGAAAASAGPGFADVAFPAGSVNGRHVLSPGGAGLYAITQFDVCTPATNVQTVDSFFTSQLAASGWTSTADYPFDGGYLASCGDPFCWFKDTAPRYVSLEQVTERGNGIVSYHLRLATPPPSPNCQPPTFQGPPYQNFFPTSAATDLPLPPLTEFGALTTSLNLMSESLCSAGTATTASAFMQSELQSLGWTQGELPAADSCGATNTPFSGWVKGARGVSWQTANGATLTPNGVVWTISYCSAG